MIVWKIWFRKFQWHIYRQSRPKKKKISLKEHRLICAVISDKITLVITYRWLTIKSSYTNQKTIKSSYVSCRLKISLDSCILVKYMLYQVRKLNLSYRSVDNWKSLCCLDMFFPNWSDKINKWNDALQEKFETCMGSIRVLNNKLNVSRWERK